MPTITTLDQKKVMSAFNHIHLVVLDSVGTGTAPDANNFVNTGVPDGASDTLDHILKTVRLTVPSMVKIGLGDIPRETPLKTVPAKAQPSDYATKLEGVSHREDTMAGHWEIMGLNITEPLDTFLEGFPEEVLIKVEEFLERKITHEANKPYSGTQVITDFGERQMKTGELIIYTSADPVLQIAVHEDVIPLDELYKIRELTCSITLERPNLLSRIIARPYVGKPGNFTCTANRRDYTLSPFAPTVLSKLADAGIPTYGVEKTNGTFNGPGITNDMGHDESGMHGVDTLAKALQLSEFTKRLSSTNLVNFDAMYGHRHSAAGYRDCLEGSDNHLSEITENMKSDDLFLITADHGNGPAYAGADHTREYIPLLAYDPSFKGSGALSAGHFTDISATIAGNFGVETAMIGQSFLEKLV